jgi:hypothetical protein
MNREFRPGEMRHLISDTTVIRNAGYRPAVSLEEGIERYLEWIRQQGSVKDYFAAAELILHHDRCNVLRRRPFGECPFSLLSHSRVERSGSHRRSHSLGSAYRRESDHSRCTDATAQAAKNAGAMLVSQPTPRLR